MVERPLPVISGRLVGAAVVLLIALHAALGVDVISRLALCGDEAPHITDGYVHWSTGNRELDSATHAPLSSLWATLPLLFMRPMDYIEECGWDSKMPDSLVIDCTSRFIYHNRVPPLTMLWATRLMILLSSLPLALAVLFYTRARANLWGGLAALFLYCLCPSILANATVVGMDEVFTLFFFLSCITVALFNQKPSIKTSLLAGSMLGLAVASKGSAIFLPVILAGLCLYHAWFLKPPEQFRPRLRFGCLIVVAAFITLGAAYGWDPISFLRMLYAQTNHSVLRDATNVTMYFHGKYVSLNTLFILLNLLLKTPIPLMLLAGAGACVFIKNYRWSLSKGLDFIALSCLGTLVAAILLYKLQIYNRYVLFMYPLFCVLGGAFLGRLLESAPRKIALPVLFVSLLTYAASSLKVHPYYFYSRIFVLALKSPI